MNTTATLLAATQPRAGASPIITQNYRVTRGNQVNCFSYHIQLTSLLQHAAIDSTRRSTELQTKSIPASNIVNIGEVKVAHGCVELKFLYKARGLTAEDNDWSVSVVT